jgi:sugar lactone lactonase YvrE
MKSRWFGLLVFLSFTGIVFSLAPTPKSVMDLGGSSAWGDDDDKLPFPKNATVTTLITTPRLIEGLTGDHRNLYTAASGTPPCAVWRINIHNPSLIPIGFVVAAGGNCDLGGIAFNEIGDLFVADAAAGTIYTFNPSAENPPNAAIFASGVPGANSIAFDKKGNLWVSDGVTAQGRVWKITGPGANCTSTPAINCEEVFRVQPMANEVNLDPSGVGGVGRDVRWLPQGRMTVTPTSRSAALNTTGCPTPPGPPCVLGSTALVANGIAFDKDGDKLFIADTARGAIWKATFDRDGHLKSKTGCDTTFAPNTLCLDNVFVAHPYLAGADGIALDRDGNIWVVAVERQAIVVVTKHGKVIEVFRNPVNSPSGFGLRNAGDQSVGNNHILEAPTSPFIIGKVFCTAQADFGLGDNSPRSTGEVLGGQPQDGPIPLAKISCIDQELKIPGLRLPID